jgi:hypothetical protein
VDHLVKLDLRARAKPLAARGARVVLHALVDPAEGQHLTTTGLIEALTATLDGRYGQQHVTLTCSSILALMPLK